MGFIAFDTKHKNYNDKSCSSLEKAYYRPIEAALRWCGLVELESAILEKIQGGSMPAIYDFPQWPCLRVNAEKIFDAIENREIPHGRDGRTVHEDDHVAPARVTVRHTDLKIWVAKHFPDQKPDFLFGEIERTTHAAINTDTFRALQADRDGLKVRIEKAELVYRTIKQERDELKFKCDALALTQKNITTTERNTLLTIIAGLCEYSAIRHQERGASGEIAKLTQEIGAAVTDETILKVLKQIPDALAPRMK